MLEMKSSHKPAWSRHFWHCKRPSISCFFAGKSEEEILLKFSCQTPPEFPSLNNNEIHIWRISLDIAKYDLKGLRQYLSMPECAKAARFHFDEDQQRYIIGRGMVRLLLGQYLHIPPSQLEICHGQYGKPFLDPKCNSMTISFNVSHSSNIMLCAISSDRQIGIDIEYISPDIDVYELADRFFSTQEAALLKSLPAEERLESFYAFWTIKEAYLKAIGIGVANGLDSVDVPYSVVESLVLGRKGKTETRWRNWWLKVLRPGPGYIASVAVEGPQLELKYWDWIEDRSILEHLEPKAGPQK